MNKLIGIIVAFLMVGGFAVQMCQNTCPEGNGWVKIDSNDMSLYPVEGACAYCFKAGSDNSQGCEGGIYDSWPLPENACGLSHWSYKLCDPTATPTIVENTPTSTNTQEPSPTFTVSPTVETPTPTETLSAESTPTPDNTHTPCPTPSDISPTPSDTPRPTFTPGPSPTSSGNGLG